MTWTPIDTGDPAAMWWWLSFCDTDRPKGEQFLGVSIVQAPNHGAAAPAAWANGCNPGGEVMILGPIHDGNLPAPEYLNRLLTKAEAMALVPSTLP